MFILFLRYKGEKKRNKHSTTVLYDMMVILSTGSVIQLFLVRFGQLSGHLLGKKLLTRLTICSLCILAICNFNYCPFWF